MIIAVKQRNTVLSGVEAGPYDVEVQIKKHLDEAGIEIPFKQMDVHVKK